MISRLVTVFLVLFVVSTWAWDVEDVKLALKKEQCSNCRAFVEETGKYLARFASPTDQEKWRSFAFGCFWIFAFIPECSDSGYQYTKFIPEQFNDYLTLQATNCDKYCGGL